MQLSRKDFIKKLGIGTTAAFLGSSILSSCEHNAKTKGKGAFENIGLQVYSIRDLLLQDPKLTLETVAKIGYGHIETFGLDNSTSQFWGLGINDLSKILSDNNLNTHSGHYDMSKYLSRHHTDKEDIEQFVEVAKKLGQSYVIAPITPMFDLNKLDAADYQYAANQLNKAGEIAKKAGVTIGFHNHFWELRRFANGTRGLDILLAFTEPDLVTFELDLFWVEKAGINPQSYFQKFPNRFPLWHIKDMDKNFTTPVVGEAFDQLPLDSIMTHVKFTEVGTGAVDYPLLAQNQEQAGLKYAFVEQDDIYLPNKFESIKKSYDYVQRYLAK